MSTNIDNRIVNLQMKTDQFKNAANSAIQTLKSLGDSLKMSEGAKGLENIAGKIKSVDLSGLSDGIDAVKSRFSALDIVGVTALVNIANSAVNAGKNLLSSLTLDPIMDGFREYETKMNSIQTILTNTKSKGTTLDDVNTALAELNDYSDQTIYNFAQMTDNIGKATAAGVGLSDAVTFVKGLANVAAGFGVDAMSMAGATQQMTQALASGTIRLQDWMSMENRGMGGELIQSALLQTAQEMGVYVDTSKGFRYSLEQNWLSSEIFIKTMEKMANDQSLVAAATQVTSFTKLIDTLQESVGSGWAVTWETLIGNKEESTALFTAINNGLGSVIGKMADYRNENLKAWKDAGGREAILKAFANIFQSIGNILGPLYDAFQKIINPWSSDRLLALSNGFLYLTEKMKISDKTGEYIQKTFEGLFSIFKIASTLITPVIVAFTKLAGVAGEGGGGLIECFFRLTAALTGWITKLSEFLQQSGYVEKSVAVIEKVANNLSSILSKLYTEGSKWFNVGVGYAKTYLSEFAVIMGDWINQGSAAVAAGASFVAEMWTTYQPMDQVKTFIVNAFNSIQNGIQSFIDFTKSAVDSVVGFFDSIVQRVKGLNIQGIDFVNAGLFASLILVIKKVVPLIKEFFSAVGDFKDSAIGVLEELQGVLESYQKSIKADMIQKIAIAVGVLAASMFILSKIEPDRLLPSVAALGGVLGAVLVAMKLFEKFDPSDIKTNISTTILLLGLSLALLNVAKAMTKLSELSWGEIASSMVGLGGAIGALIVAVKMLDGANIGPKQASAIMTLSTSLLLFSAAMAIIGNLETATIVKSLTSIAAIMTGLSLFLNSTKNVDNAAKVGLSLIPLATSMVVLAGALAIFGNMDHGTLLQGFIVLSSLLAAFSAFGNSLKQYQGDMVNVGAGVLLLSSALLVLSAALAILGNMETETIVKGLISIAAALAIITTAINLMPKNITGVGGSIVALSAGLLILSGAMVVLGGLSWEQIAKGLTTVVAALIIFGTAAALLTPVLPSMLLLAGAIAALGAAALLVGGSLAVLSVGMTMLSGALIGTGASILAALTTISAAIPVLAAALALGIVSFISVLGYNGPAIERALISLIDALLNTIIASTPKIIEAVKVFLQGILDSIIELSPQIAEAITTILKNLIDVVGTLLGDLLNAVIKYAPLFAEAVITFISAFLDTINTLVPKMVDTVVNVIMCLLTALTENIPKIADLVTTSLFELITTVLNNLAEAIGPISQAIVNIIVAILNSIGNGVPQIVTAIFDMIIQMIDGLAVAIETKMPEVRAAIQRLVTAIITEFGAAVKDAVDVGGNIIDGLKRGISNGIGAVVQAAKNVASRALEAAMDFLGIHSPSREFAKLGMYSSEGLALGISNYGGLVEDSATSVADTALSSMREALNSVDSLMNSDMNSNPVIKPVIDLTEIQNGVKDVNGLLETDTMGINYAINNTPKISPRTNSQSDASQGANSSTANASSISFVQNNYSPKELSRLEIYRQTKNQFSMLKGVLT